MTDTFETVKVAPSGLLPGDVVKAVQGDLTALRWITVERKVPVPPLPTAPYTVIRVTWAENGHNGDLTLHSDGLWYGRAMRSYGPSLLKDITGFEVLSEPRAVTAKAAVEFLTNETLAPLDAVDMLAQHFGVTP